MPGIIINEASGSKRLMLHVEWRRDRMADIEE
jgi:hypothetical protein